jgi:hypothetical protein
MPTVTNLKGGFNTIRLMSQSYDVGRARGPRAKRDYRNRRRVNLRGVESRRQQRRFQQAPNRVEVVPITSNIDCLYLSEAKITLNGKQNKAMADPLMTVSKGRILSSVGRLSDPTCERSISHKNTTATSTLIRHSGAPMQAPHIKELYSIAAKCVVIAEQSFAADTPADGVGIG